MRRLPGGIGPLALIALLGAGLMLWLGLIPKLAFDLIFVLSLAVSLTGSLPRFGLSGGRARLAALGFGALGVLLVLFAPGVAVVPYLAIALAYAQLTYVFAHGLMPGRQPVLEQLIRLMALLPDGSPEFWRFVRRQCQLWTVLGCTMTLAAIVGLLVPDARQAAGSVLSSLMVVQLLAFILSHFYANWRYGRPETWQATLQAMLRPAIWSKLQL